MPVHRTAEPLVLPATSTGVLKDLAARGALADAVVDPVAFEHLRAAAYDLVWPLVWARHTRRLELSKGHPRCASSFGQLESACLDGFHDDVEAVVEYLFRFACGPIHSVEGWITSRIRAAVVDGHRRRRSRRGALQRVRVPGWLVTELDGDPWLTELAARVIEWVGVPGTAGLELWPFDAWAELRARTLGDRAGSHPRRVGDDLEYVLGAMRRTRPDWFATYVERPLGTKQLPVTPAPGVEDVVEAPRAGDDDARLAALAASAVEAISAGLAAERAPAEVVSSVVRALFLDGADADCCGPPERDRWLGSVLADERGVSELVDRVLDVVQRNQPGASG